MSPGFVRERKRTNTNESIMTIVNPLPQENVSAWTMNR